MKKQLEQLEEFQKGFNLTHNDTPVNLPLKEGLLRFKLLKEENEEYLEGVQNGDRVEIADALADQLYIVLGSIVSHGMQGIIEEVFEAVHSSNMSKLDAAGLPIINGQNGVLDPDKPIGKVIKSDRYFPPEHLIKTILEKAK